MWVCEIYSYKPTNTIEEITESSKLNKRHSKTTTILRVRDIAMNDGHFGSQ